MEEIIEASIETPDGVADCRFELMDADSNPYYNVTILYPHVVNGFSRSEIYSHDMHRGNNGRFRLDPSDENIHPKVKRLEDKLAEAIRNA